MSDRSVPLLVLLGLCAVVSPLTLPNHPTTRGNELGSVTDPIPIEEFIKQFGYRVETHVIKTEDGYILTYHRIPGRKGSSTSRPGRPVLLQHGLLCSSTIWVMSTKALAYVLVDAGYDVWLGNARGNTYSRKHVTFDPDKDKDFWDYSWHEMGYYDLPASIDYILQETGRDKLFYMGHSMGTTMFFVLGATRPQYMDKVQAAFLMAPVATPFHIHQERFLLDVLPILKWILRDTYEVLPNSPETIWFNDHVCAHPRLQVICRKIIFATCGYDEAQLNRTFLPIAMQYLPAGASHKELTHYGQIALDEQVFRQYDYGLKGNLWKYGSPTPPVYNLSLVATPLYLYYSQNDWLAVPQDVLYAAKQLPNVQRLFKVPYEKFNHIDFMWAIDAKTLLYDEIITALKSIP